jgi:hypothetical protein
MNKNKIKLIFLKNILILCFIFLIFFNFQVIYSSFYNIKSLYFLCNYHVAIIFTEPYKYKYGESKAEYIIDELIKTAKKSIKIMIFDIDSAKLIKTLLQKQKENVDIQIIIDEKNTPPEVKDIFIQKNMIIPYKNSKYMHHKIILIDNNILITGSANFTVNCLYKNNNDIIVLSKLKLDFIKNKFDKNYYDSISIRNLSEETLNKEFDKIFNYFNYYFELFKDKENLTKNLVQKEQLFSINRSLIRILFTKFIFKDSNDNLYEVNDVIKDYIKKSLKRIVFSYSTFTNIEIANLIINRTKEKNLEFLGMLESLNAGSKYSVFQIFEENNMNIFKDRNEGLLHHKFLIIDSYLLTGSYAIAERTNKISSKKYNDDLLIIFQDNNFANIYYFYLNNLVKNQF